MYARYEHGNISAYFDNTYRETLLTNLPEGTFEKLNGEKITYKEIKGESKVLFVHFWGTWCAPCETEFPALVRFISKFDNQDKIHFALVAVNDEVKKINKFLKNYEKSKHRFTVYLDNEDNFKLKFGTTRVPESYVFGMNESVLKKFSGPQDWDKDFYFRYLKSIL